MNPSSLVPLSSFSNHFQMTFLSEIAYLKFTQNGINKEINEKKDLIFLSTSEKVQQNFKKYCHVQNLTKILPDELLDVKKIIKTLWDRMQEIQYSKLAADCTVKMNQTASGYCISFAQAQWIMSGMKMNEMAINIVNFVIKAKQCIVFYDHPNQSIQEYMNKHLKSQSGLNGNFYKSIPEWRKEYKIPETLMISAVCEEHLFNKDKIIEIGAGKLEKGLSYLMERMPSSLSKRVEPTEVHNAFRKDVTGYKRVDLCKMNESYSPSSVDKIIGSSVLDVLSTADLTIALQQIHATLKPGGKLIHFAHMEPFIDTLLTSFREDSSVCFPWEDEESFKGLLCVQKDKLLNFISKNEDISAIARGFLSWYSDLTASERELTLNSIIMGGKETSRKFCKWIKAMNPDGLENIDNLEFFEERMKSALEKAHFEIEKFGCRWQNHVRDRCNDDNKDHNYFAWELNKKTATTCYVLPPEKVCHAVKMHIIVAKKKEGNFI